MKTAKIPLSLNDELIGPLIHRTTNNIKHMGVIRSVIRISGNVKYPLSTKGFVLVVCVPKI